MPNRDAQTGQLQVEDDTHWPTYDLVVIGGGINGTGIARDAAQRGLKVLLLEKTDFGAGTSAYSSRLIHGGLRYLANLEFDLVRESLRERELLLKNAPHLVKPLPLAIPVYQGGKNPLWQIEIGMWLYDLLSWGKHMPRHQLLNRNRFLQTYPGINPRGLQGGPIYYDAQAELPERICVENTLAALETGHASMINHARVEQFELGAFGLKNLRFQDLLSQKSYTVHGKVYINATGPWVDEVLKLSEGKHQQKLPQQRIGGTKGTHIVVRRFSDAPETALYAEARADGRPFFIIPWREDTILIGTTDTHYHGSIDAVCPTAEEVDYLLAETNHVLPKAHLTEADILYAYAGVRPLPFAAGKQESKITRKHWIVDHAQDQTMPIPALLSVIGGKLTTYRNLAEETVNYAIHHYHLTLPGGKPVPASNTREIPLPGAANIENWQAYQDRRIPELIQKFDLPPEIITNLLSLYGSRTSDVLALSRENPAWLKPLAPHCNVLAAQVVYAVRIESAFTAEDVLLRRLGCGLDADLGLAVLEPTAHLMGQLLGWPEHQVQTEIKQYKQGIEERNLSFKARVCAPL